MNDGETRHRPLPEETTPADSPRQEDQPSDASVEVDQAARSIQDGSLRGELTQLGECINVVRIRVDREDGRSKHLQPELDDLKQQHRLAMKAMGQFESKSASEWEAFRNKMEQTHQELRDCLDAIRRRLPHTDFSNTNTKEEKS